MSDLICHTMLCNWIFNTCTNNIITFTYDKIINIQKVDINTHLFNILRIINIIIVVVVMIIIIICLKYKLNLG